MEKSCNVFIQKLVKIIMSLFKKKKYSFRIRITRSPTDTINIESPSITIKLPESPLVLTFTSREKDKNIENSDEWVLKSSGWSTYKAALEAGKQCQIALSTTLARLRIGADFGGRGPKSVVTNAGLQMFEKQKGQRCLNDTHGLMVFEPDPAPLFVKASAKALRGVQDKHFLKTFKYALQNPPNLADRELLSLDLFFASFFQQSADARFLLLVSAIEALFDSQPRSAEAVEHVDKLKDLTRKSKSLSHQEKDSILGSLQWLHYQSIRQTAHQLIMKRLGSNIYRNQIATDFFDQCYDVRSRLVHGLSPVPTWNEVSSLSGHLEGFVSDLLTKGLFNFER